MDEGSLQVPKKQMPVTLWVHPEGRVLGALFLRLPEAEGDRGEEPADVLNECADFVVVKLDNPDALCFYNKRSIVRVEYFDGTCRQTEGRPAGCRVNLMDGSTMDGEIIKSLPRERSRLYDYMNDDSEHFLKLCLSDGTVVLLNKNYVVSILPLERDETVTEPPEPAPGGSLELAA